MGHAETPDRDAVDAVHARLELVAPRDVIGGARREDFDLRVSGEMFGDVARVQLGAAVDRLSVALSDDGELHCWSSVSGAPGSDRSGAADGSVEVVEAASGRRSIGGVSPASACVSDNGG